MIATVDGLKNESKMPKHKFKLVGALLLLIFSKTAVSNEEEACEAKDEKQGKLRENMDRLSKLVETHICKSASTKTATTAKASASPTKSASNNNADPCNQDFEPIEDKSSKFVVCNLRLEDFNEKFTMKSIDSKLCTHALLSGFFKVNAETVEFTENKSDAISFSSLVSFLKSKSLKIWLSVGADGTLEPDEYSNFTKSEDLRSKFIANVMKIINSNALDGFSPRWRYPACPYEWCYKYRKADLPNFLSLMDALSAELRPKELSLIVYTTKSFMFKSMFEFASLKKFVDYWLIVCYNSEGNSSQTATTATAIDFFEKCLNGYLAQIPNDTAIVGVTLFYHPAKLLSAKATTLGSAVKKDVKGNSTLNSFRNVCTAINNVGGKLVHNETNRINSYWTQDVDWVSVESTFSVLRKLEVVPKFNIPGVFLEHISDDDFDGTACKCGKYPILRTMNEVVRGEGKCIVPLCPTSKPVIDKKDEKSAKIKSK